MNEPRDVVSGVPTDIEHPKLYEYSVLGLGTIAVLCLLVIALLLIFGRESDYLAAGISVVGAGFIAAINGLVQLLKPRAA